MSMNFQNYKNLSPPVITEYKKKYCRIEQIKFSPQKAENIHSLYNSNSNSQTNILQKFFVDGSNISPLSHQLQITNEQQQLPSFGHVQPINQDPNLGQLSFELQQMQMKYLSKQSEFEENLFDPSINSNLSSENGQKMHFNTTSNSLGGSQIAINVNENIKPQPQNSMLNQPKTESNHLEQSIEQDENNLSYYERAQKQIKLLQSDILSQQNHKNQNQQNYQTYQMYSPEPNQRVQQNIQQYFQQKTNPKNDQHTQYVHDTIQELSQKQEQSSRNSEIFNELQQQYDVQDFSVNEPSHQKILKKEKSANLKISNLYSIQLNIQSSFPKDEEADFESNIIEAADYQDKIYNYILNTTDSKSIKSGRSLQQRIKPLEENNYFAQNTSQSQLESNDISYFKYKGSENKENRSTTPQKQSQYLNQKQSSQISRKFTPQSLYQSEIQPSNQEDQYYYQMINRYM